MPRPFLLLLCLWLAPTLAFGATAKREVTDAEGTRVTVPAAATRVVALSEIDLDICLALGVEPVGTINGRGQKAHPHYLQASGIPVARIPIVGDLGRPSLEALVRLQPDLILTAPSRPETLAVLRKIAPTVVTYRNDDPWKDVFLRVAGILGRDAKATEFLARYEQELAAAKAKLAKAQGKTASIVRWNPNGPAFMYRDSFASTVLRDMGLERPEGQRVPGQKHSMPLSLEALAAIDGDYLFVGTLDPKGEAADAMKEMESRPAFQRLEAVKGKRYHVVDGSKWTSIGGPLAALSLVEETTRLLAK